MFCFLISGDVHGMTQCLSMTLLPDDRKCSVVFNWCHVTGPAAFSIDDIESKT